MKSPIEFKAVRDEVVKNLEAALMQAKKQFLTSTTELTLKEMEKLWCETEPEMRRTLYELLTEKVKARVAERKAEGEADLDETRTDPSSGMGK